MNRFQKCDDFFVRAVEVLCRIASENRTGRHFPAVHSLSDVTIHTAGLESQSPNLFRLVNRNHTECEELLFNAFVSVFNLIVHVVAVQRGLFNR